MSDWRCKTCRTYSVACLLLPVDRESVHLVCAGPATETNRSRNTHIGRKRSSLDSVNGRPRATALDRVGAWRSTGVRSGLVWSRCDLKRAAVCENRGPTQRGRDTSDWRDECSSELSIAIYANECDWSGDNQQAMGARQLDQSTRRGVGRHAMRAYVGR